jgi:hypothetical protein
VFIASPNTLPKIKVSIPKVGLGKLEEKLGSGWMERGIAFYAKR